MTPPRCHAKVAGLISTADRAAANAVALSGEQALNSQDGASTDGPRPVNFRARRLGAVAVGVHQGRPDISTGSRRRHVSSGQDYAADPSKFSALAGDQFAGLRLWPTGVPALDDLPLSPVFVDIARDLTGSSDVRFVRGGYQAKYTDAADYTQVLDCDYPNHSLVVPAPNDILGFFLYLSDVDTAHGATRLVSNQVSGPTAPDATHALPPYACFHRDWHGHVLEAREGLGRHQFPGTP